MGRLNDTLGTQRSPVLRPARSAGLGFAEALAAMERWPGVFDGIAVALGGLEAEAPL
jgi:hypothetical protein